MVPAVLRDLLANGDAGTHSVCIYSVYNGALARRSIRMSAIWAMLRCATNTMRELEDLFSVCSQAVHRVKMLVVFDFSLFKFQIRFLKILSSN